MADRTGIEWTDATWNPLRGCSRVSEGCRHCYAETVAARFSGPGLPYEGLIHPKTKGWNGTIKLVPEVLDQPLRWKRPRRIFVNSMSDLFHEGVPDEFIDQVFMRMMLAPRHTFQVLTKRPERMRAYLAGDRMNKVMAAWQALPLDIAKRAAGWTVLWPLTNVWLGVSVEDQATANERIPLLLQIPAAVRWISAEPLLGPVDLTRICLGESPAEFYAGSGFEDCKKARITIDATRGVQSFNPKWPPLAWVVAGGESGHSARPMHPDWARSLRDQCAAAGVPFLFKQWGEFAPTDRTMAEVRCSERKLVPVPMSAESLYPAALLDRVGKKAAGRHLDGVLHDAYPETH